MQDEQSEGPRYTVSMDSTSSSTRPSEIVNPMQGMGQDPELEKDFQVIDDGSPQQPAGPPQGRGDPKPKSNLRHIRLPFDNRTPKGKPMYPTNFVSSSKYTVWSFLPKNLAEQFSKAANVYFLVQSILVCFPQISPYVWYSTIAPFAFVLTLSALKDAYADFLRHQDDNATNQQLATVLRDGIWQSVQWQHLVVGDYVQIEDGGQVPADTVILATQLAADDTAKLNEAGVCFVDTKALDGETNLKPYGGPAETADLRTPDALSRLGKDLHPGANLVSEQPNGMLYHYEGTLTVGPTAVPLKKENVLLRGMKLCNTHKVWGVVVFTGFETKIVKNNERDPGNKKSNMDKTLNRLLLWVFIVQVLLCLGFAIGSGLFFSRYGMDSWYLALSDAYEDSLSTNWYGTNKDFLVGFLSFFTFFILLANMVPISLYVTVEFIKFFTGSPPRSPAG